ncbi:MAG TPA: peptidoglycan-binding domain-containing protein [Candidatus Limnocylindria bacterium]|nr:peptidoglycan-binding domain-containing protein [Candidatus Limnocylindria bacterium]
MVPTVGLNDRNAHCGLGPGNSNQAVFKLQQALNTCYGAGIGEDSIYGQATQAALRNAQSQAGITPDGLYGPESARHILWPAHGPDNAFLGCSTYPNVPA